jgi:protoporphyrinogen oxidase
MTRLAIVGGGVSGLTLAYALEQLEREGLRTDIDLYEAANGVGGVIQTAWYEKWPVELGPDSLVDRQRGAIELCRRIGLEKNLVGIRAAAKPPLVRNAEGFKPFPHSETRSYTLKGGVSQLPETLAQSLHRTTIYLHTAVTKVFRNLDGWYINDDRGPYRGLILAVPASALHNLLHDVNVDVSWAKQITYQPRAVMAAIYARDSFVDPSLLSHTGFIVSPETGLGLTALTWLSTKWAHYEESGPIICRTFWGPPSPNPDQWSDDEVQLLHETALNRLVGPHEPPIWTKLMRYHTALPKVPQELSWQYPLPLSDDVPYLGVLGPYREGPGVSDCVRLAWEEAYRYAQWGKNMHARLS